MPKLFSKRYPDNQFMISLIKRRVGLWKCFTGLLIVVFSVVLLSSCEPSYTPVTHTVMIKNLKFIPEQLTIHKGDTVKWINYDALKHDVTEETVQGWTSGVMEKDAIWKRAITETTEYFCSLHVVMKGKLLVE